MPTDAPTCPKCTGPMEPGYVADAAHGQILQSAWSPGEPEARRVFGGIKWKPEERVPLTALRCADCGFVEFYARSD